MFSHLLVITAAAGYAAAQFSNISVNCSAALVTISNDAATSACLSPLSLAGLATGGSPISIIDSWLNKICPAAPCSNATLAYVVNTVAGGCSNELASAGITAPPSTLVSIVQASYPTVREIACLKDGKTNCVTETLTNLQSATNQTISVASIISAVSQFNTLPSNVACTSCIKASYNIIAKQEPSEASKLQRPLQSKCGASFTDGTTPSGIVESASTTSASKSNAAAQLAPGSNWAPVMVSLGLTSLLAFASAIWLF